MSGSTRLLHIVGRANRSGMFGFWTRTGNLEELVGNEFLLDIGGQALRGRGPVRVVCTDLGFDLRIGPATLHTLDGAPWSVHPFSIEAGLMGDVQFEGLSFSACANAFNVMELPDSIWFGPDLRLTEHARSAERRVFSVETICLGITKQRRFRKGLEEVKWISPASPIERWTDAWLPPDLVHSSVVPEGHSGVCVAPELYAILRDDNGSPRFSFAREEYDAALQRWTNAAPPVWDALYPSSSLNSTLRCLDSSSLPFPSALLLQPWLAPELRRRSRGEPIFQLVGRRMNPGLCWIDGADPLWHTRLRQEVTRMADKSWVTANPSLAHLAYIPFGPPLRWDNGSWIAAGEAIEV